MAHREVLKRNGTAPAAVKHGKVSMQEEVLEEIALTPEANPLATPFSALRPHASHLRPILVRGSPRLGTSAAQSRDGSPLALPYGWSRFEIPGHAGSR